MKVTIYLDDEEYKWLKKYSKQNKEGMNHTVKAALNIYRKYRLTAHEAMFLGALVPQLPSLHKLQSSAVEGITFGDKLFSVINSSPQELMDKLYHLRVEKT